MQANQPITKLDVIGPLGLSSKKGIGDVGYSKKSIDLLTIHPDDPNSKINDDIQLLAIHNDNEHNAMLKVQKQMLEKSARQSIIDKNRVKLVFRIHRFLRKRFIELNSFLQDSDDKTQRALLTIKNQKTIHLQYKADNGKLREDIKQLQIFRNILSKTVKVMEPFESVLEEVVNEHEVWTSSRDIVHRCDAMMLAHDEILKMGTQAFSKIEYIKQKMIKLTAEAIISILGIRNTLDKLQRDFVKARKDCIYWENILINIKDCIFQHKIEKKLLIAEIDSLYRILCRFTQVSTVLTEYNIEKRCDFIRDEIIILNHVLKECEESNAFASDKKK